MVLEKHLEKNEDSLQMLDNSLPNANVDRFIYGLQQRSWDEPAIMAFTVHVPLTTTSTSLQLKLP